MPAKNLPPPWKRKRPAGITPMKLSAAEKRYAKELARKAGRPYPNLVDNMRVAKLKKRGAVLTVKPKK